MRYVLLRGGGDLASGVALRLQRSGFQVIITELPQPLAVRRAVSFAEAVYTVQFSVEGVPACKAGSPAEAFELLEKGIIPVLVDPDARVLKTGVFSALVDARLLKHPQKFSLSASTLVIGLGPGFTCSVNCHAAIETQRGHNLGRVLWSGSTGADTGQPDGDPRRVLRAPRSSVLNAYVRIGEIVEAGQLLAEVDGEPVIAPIPGALRGLIHPGIPISKGLKIGDIDPRGVPAFCFSTSDKALAVGGAVLEALLARRITPDPA